MHDDAFVIKENPIQSSGLKPLGLYGSKESSTMSTNPALFSRVEPPFSYTSRYINKYYFSVPSELFLLVSPTLYFLEILPFV